MSKDWLPDDFWDEEQESEDLQKDIQKGSSILRDLFRAQIYTQLLEWNATVQSVRAPSPLLFDDPKNLELTTLSTSKIDGAPITFEVTKKREIREDDVEPEEPSPEKDPTKDWVFLSPKFDIHNLSYDCIDGKVADCNEDVVDAFKVFMGLDLSTSG